MKMRIWAWNWNRILAWATLAFFLFCGTAILYPNFVCARYAARQAMCLTNVKNQCIALLQYASDNNDCLPEAPVWMDKAIVYELDRDSFHCPSLPNGQCGYAFMDKLNSIDLKSIDSPSETVIVVESKDTRWNAHGDMALLPDRPRHSNSNMICFADGHVKKINDFELKHLRRQ